MTRWLILLGVALLTASAALYFTEDASVVTIDDPDRELTLTCGATRIERFRIHNPTRRTVRVVGIAEC